MFSKVKEVNDGFVAFTSLLVISAVALIVAISIALLGIGESRASLDFKKGQEVLKAAEGCVEEALLRLRDSGLYSGGALNVGDGSCNIVISGSGSSRTITVEATISDPPDYVRNIEVTVKRTGNSINILTWQESE